MSGSILNLAGRAVKARLNVAQRPPVAKLALAWLLMVPLVFLAAHGEPSFTQSGRNVEGAGSLASADATTGDAGLVRALVYVCYGIVIWVCAKNAGRIARSLQYAKPLLMLAFLAVCSSLWSQLPYVSLRSGFYYLLDTLLGVYLVSCFALEEIMVLLMMTGVAVMFSSLVLIVLFPQYGLVQWSVHHGAWQGIFCDENDAGKNLVFLLLPALHRNLLKLSNLLYALALLGFIYKTGSRTAMLAVAVVGIFIFVRAMITRLAPKSASFVALTLGLVVAAGAAVGIAAWPEIAAMLGRDATLTGRTDIWAVLLQSASARPWLGYGYAAFWTGLDGESGKVYQIVHWMFTYAHNGLLEVWLQLGLAGVCLIVYAMTRALRDALRCNRGVATQGVTWLTTLWVLTLVYNLDEGTLAFPRTLVSVMFVVMCAGLAKAAEAQRAVSLRWVREQTRQQGLVRYA